MFTVALGAWLAVFIAGSVLSVWGPAWSGRATRAVSPMYWAAVGAAVVGGVAPMVVPGVGRNQDSTDFSVDRALAHVARVAERPHPMGSAANQDVRDYVADELRELGLEPEFQNLVAPDYYGGSGSVTVVNVLARLAGNAPTGAVVVVAHVDTVPETSGANDNASGVAVMLETARHLVADGALRNDVILLFTDGEEPAPRYGSTAFVEDHRWFDDARFVVNLEAIGTGGPSMLIESNGPQDRVIDRFVDASPQPVAFSFLTETTALIGGSNTDFAPFRDAGIPGVEFAYSRGSSIYHTGADTADSVSRRSLYSHGANTLGLVRRLAADDLVMNGDGDVVFFTVGRFHVVRFPTWWAILTVIAAGTVLLVVIRGRRTRSDAMRDVAMALVAALSAAIAAVVLWVPFAGRRDTMGVSESYGALLALVALTAAVMVVPFGFGRRGERERTPVGVAVLWWCLAALTALTAPGISYLFALPALVAAVALLLGFDTSSGWRSLALAVPPVGMTMIVLIPAIDTFFQFAQPRPGSPDSEILFTVAVPVLLVALAIQVALVFRPRMEPTATGGVSADDEAPDRGAISSTG